MHLTPPAAAAAALAAYASSCEVQHPAALQDSGPYALFGAVHHTAALRASPQPQQQERDRGAGPEVGAQQQAPLGLLRGSPPVLPLRPHGTPPAQGREQQQQVRAPVPSWGRPFPATSLVPGPWSLTLDRRDRSVVTAASDGCRSADLACAGARCVWLVREE